MSTEPGGRRQGEGRIPTPPAHRAHWPREERWLGCRQVRGSLERGSGEGVPCQPRSPSFLLRPPFLMVHRLQIIGSGKFHHSDPGSVRKDCNWARISKQGLRHLSGPFLSPHQFRGVSEEVGLGRAAGLWGRLWLARHRYTGLGDTAQEA